MTPVVIGRTISGVAEIDRLGRKDYEAADRLIARVLGVPDRHLTSAVEAINLVYNRDPFVAIDGVAAQLRRVRAAGVRLAIVSNANGQLEADLLRHRICSRDGNESADVDVVIDSDVVGVEKPDPAISGWRSTPSHCLPSTVSTSGTPSISMLGVPERRGSRRCT